MFLALLALDYILSYKAVAYHLVNWYYAYKFCFALAVIL